MCLVELPPVLKRVHGEVSRVTGGRHADMPRVALLIIDPIGRGPAFRVRGKVMGIDLRRCLAPRLAGILELADQFLFLGVHADMRIAAAAEIRPPLGDVSELPVPLGMLPALVQHLAVAAQSKLPASQQPANGCRAGPTVQCLRQPAEPRPHPLFLGARIPGRFRINALQEVGNERWIFFSTRGRPPPGRRTWSTGRSSRSAASSSRPRRIVSGCSPVTSAIRLIPPCPSRRASRPTTQRRYCSCNRLNSRFNW